MSCTAMASALSTEVTQLATAVFEEVENAAVLLTIVVVVLPVKCLPYDFSCLGKRNLRQQTNPERKIRDTSEEGLGRNITGMERAK